MVFFDLLYIKLSDETISHPLNSGLKIEFSDSTVIAEIASIKQVFRASLL